MGDSLCKNHLEKRDSKRASRGGRGFQGGEGTKKTESHESKVENFKGPALSKKSFLNASPSGWEERENS